MTDAVAETLKMSETIHQVIGEKVEEIFTPYETYLDEFENMRRKLVDAQMKRLKKMMGLLKKNIIDELKKDTLNVLDTQGKSLIGGKLKYTNEVYFFDIFA